MLFNRKPQQLPDRRDRLVEELLATPPADRKFVVMTALQTGELRLSEADEVLLLVARLEALSAAPPASDSSAMFLRRGTGPDRSAVR
jgi:hypothetical protein